MKNMLHDEPLCTPCRSPLQALGALGAELQTDQTSEVPRKAF